MKLFLIKEVKTGEARAVDRPFPFWFLFCTRVHLRPVLLDSDHDEINIGESSAT